MKSQSVKETVNGFQISESEEMVALSGLCEELSISIATGRNWIRLGKIVPTMKKGRTLYFSQEYVSKIKTEIQSGKNPALKSRRNKKFVSGHNIYNSYVSDSSINIAVVEAVIDTLKRKEIGITEDIMLGLLTDCAMQLIIARTVSLDEKGNVFDFLCGKYRENPYIFLVENLVVDKERITDVIEEYPELFRYTYQYEEGEDILGLLYISLKNQRNRKTTGSYYTPTVLVNKLCSKLFSMNACKNRTVLDPCCGTGNFILQLPKEIDYRNVYGNEIDAVSVKIAQINYALKYCISDRKIIEDHITNGDYLDFTDEKKYDFIIGNPPWGYVFLESDKKQLRKRYKSAATANIESYDVFCEKALYQLKDGGVLSFIVPEAILNVKAHKAIREVMSKCSSVQYIEFLGNAFDKVQCPCVILQILHTGEPLSTVGMVVNDGAQEFTVQEQRFVNAGCFSFMISDEEYAILNKLDMLEWKTTLDGKADFALGIVTGNNKKYISTEKCQGNEMVLKGTDIYKYEFRKAENYLAFQPQLFQQVAPTVHYRAKEKLFYRFICDQLVFAYDEKQTLSLNSCNIVIPHIEGLSMKYIMAILNSRVAQFYFKKRFNSVKVLRSHVEQIPIPFVNERKQKKIIAQIDQLLASSSNERVKIYDKIDREISKLYNLTAEEYSLVYSSVDEEKYLLS